MKELSVFIDESGDFGQYDNKAPYYIIAMVFHDQSSLITDAIDNLNRELSYMSLDNICFHTGPIIRREEIYGSMSISDRRNIFNKLIAFFRQVDIRYKCIEVEKKYADDVILLTSQLSRKMSMFISEHYGELSAYDVVKVYYDNGQLELSRILASVFSALLPQTQFRKVMPKDYKLFQIADLVCTMELLNHKLIDNSFARSETLFFGSKYDFKRNYLRIVQKKEWN